MTKIEKRPFKLSAKRTSKTLIVTGINKKVVNPKAKTVLQLNKETSNRTKIYFLQKLISALNSKVEVYFIDEMGSDNNNLPKSSAHKNKKPYYFIRQQKQPVVLL